MKYKRHHNLTIFFTVFILSVQHAWAESWQNSVTSQISTEYDTNPAMIPNYSNAVIRSLLEPAYTLTGNLDEDEIKTGVALQIARSSNELLSPNRNSPNIFADWLHQINTGELGISARYIEIATRDAGIDATGRVPVASARISRILTGRWSKALNDHSTLSGDGSYEGISYTRGAFVNYATRSANLIFSYDLSEINTPFLRASQVIYEPADGSQMSKFSSATIGWRWMTSDQIEGSADVGSYKINDTDVGTVGAVAAQYTGLLNVLNIYAGRQTSPSGLGGFVTSDSLNGGWTHALNDISKTGIDLAWRKTHFTSDVIHSTMGVWLHQDINYLWGLRIYYLHNTITGETLEGAYSNIVGFSFSYTHNDF